MPTRTFDTNLFRIFVVHGYAFPRGRILVLFAMSLSFDFTLITAMH
jgi:hypothetical protein